MSVSAGSAISGRRPPSWLSSPRVRRLYACLATGVVVALITGKTGSNAAPTSGITGTFKSTNAYLWIAGGVLLWALLELRERYAERISEISGRQLLAGPRARLSERKVRYPAWAVLLGFAILLPSLVNGFWQEVLVGQIAPYVLLAVGLNVVVGLAGLLDLGFIAFYAIGAYSAAYWTGSLPVHPPFQTGAFWAIPLAIVTAMVAGLIIGLPTLRLRGDYLAIVTLGFGLIISLVANNLTSITGGAQGVPHTVPVFSVHAAGVRYTWPQLELLDHKPWYYLILAFTVIVVILFSLLENSRVGRAWVAVREDEVAAEACGINPLKYKVMAFMIGASTSGLAGVFFASKTGFFNPGDFPFSASVLIVVLVIFGGMGSLPGAIIGAAVLQFLPQYLRGHIPSPDLYAYYGALLVVMMIFRPQGILPSKRRAREFGLAEAGLGSADALGGQGQAP